MEPGIPDTGIVAFDRNGLEILSREACLELLGSKPVGRVAFNWPALPAILPVTFQLIGEDIIFATGTGSKSLAVRRGTVLAFEVDEIDAGTRAGWSVLVVGKARELDPRRLTASLLRQLDLRPWAGRHASKLIRLPTERLSGRRLPASAGPLEPSDWATERTSPAPERTWPASERTRPAAGLSNRPAGGAISAPTGHTLSCHPGSGGR